MTPTTKRAPRSRDLQLSLAALLAFASWLALLAFFIGFPVLYLLTIPVTVPILAGAVGLVVVLFLLYYLLAGSLHCQVCGGPVFGGGEGHRKHPHSRKFLGISYSRQVAAEILSMRGFHCMHCQTFCRSRRKSQRLPDELAGVGPGTLADQMFQTPSPSAQEPTAPSQALFENIFNPAPTSQSPPNSPTPMSQPREIVHPERTPWSHHPQVNPFSQPDAMNTPIAPIAPTRTAAPPIAAAPPPLPPQASTIASPFSILAPPPPAPIEPPSNIAVPPPMFPAPTPLTTPEAVLPAPMDPPKPVTSPFEVLTQAVAPKPQATISTALPALEKGPLPQISQPILPELTKPPVLPPLPSQIISPPPVPIPAPVSAPAPAPTPAETAPDLQQVVTEVSSLIEQTRQSLNQLFSEMVSQLKTALVPVPAPVPDATTVAPPPALEISTASSTPMLVAVAPAEVESKLEEPTLPPSPPVAALTALDITDLAEEAPAPLPAAPTAKPVAAEAPVVAKPAAPAVDSTKAAVLNEMLARAFAQRQSAPPVPAPAPVLPPAPPVSVPPVSAEELPPPRAPQSPFQIVQELESPLDNPMAAFPFPPLPEESPAPQGVFSSLPPLPPWDTLNEDSSHPAPFTFLSKPENAAPEAPKPTPEWSLPPLKQAPPPPINWPTPNGKA